MRVTEVAYPRRQGTVLPHVTWPLVPEADESLVGFVARTCHHNGLWNAKPLMDDVGLRVSRGIGHLPRVAADLTGLATVLAVDVEWVEERRQGSARSPRTRRKSLLFRFHPRLCSTGPNGYAKPTLWSDCLLRDSDCAPL